MKRIILYVITFIFLYTLSNINSYSDDSIDVQPVESSVFRQNQDNLKIKSPRIFSASAIIIDKSTGRVLYEKNGYSRRPMASTTKIMTAILALENGKLFDTVTVSQRSARVGGSNIHLVKGEKISLNDLLYGLMLSSGNDAAIAIAEHIGGSVENFAELMTNKAHAIGAANSAFKTPHGLDKDGHYSTAYDLAIMARYALKIKKFAEIVSTRQTVISNGKRLSNTNEMLNGYPGADGVKTGYTGKGGRCLVTSATRNGWQLISVVLGSASRQIRASDSSKLLNYAFNNYKMININNLDSKQCQIEVHKGEINSIIVKKSTELYYPLRNDEIANLTIKYDLPEKITAPVIKGTVIGCIEYSVNGKPIIKKNVTLNKDINKKSVINFYQEIIQNWLENRVWI